MSYIESHARKAYVAYCEAVGKGLPEWEALSVIEQCAWRAVARAILGGEFA